MPRTRPAYPEEFRANAVKLLRSSGKTLVDVAKDLGCSANALR
ncbi:MAG TPA: transposase, partial [Candidatus Limnocylindria bacterium]|nr:transposase [Candidatus Limnocylindria bacterium]HZP95915.1 transposase [Candidatus Limnocylindria bacterium]